MMNMGPAKGAAVEALVAARRPRRLLEVGTFLSYMTIRLAAAMPADARVTTVEVDAKTFAAAERIRRAALDAATLRRVDARLANASDVLPTFREPFDFVLMDHWKPEYAATLEALRSRGLLADGATVVADNVLFQGAPELLDYLGVPFEPATDGVSGQACLASDARDGAVFASRGRGATQSFTSTCLGRPSPGLRNSRRLPCAENGSRVKVSADLRRLMPR